MLNLYCVKLVLWILEFLVVNNIPISVFRINETFDYKRCSRTMMAQRGVPTFILQVYTITVSDLSISIFFLCRYL